MGKERIVIDAVIKQEKVLEPEDAGFEEAAREHGLWLPSGYQDEESGTFFETFEHMAPNDEDFEATLEEVLERGLYATARVPEEG